MLTILTDTKKQVTVSETDHPYLTIAWERWLETDEGSDEASRTWSHLLDAAQDVLTELGHEDEDADDVREEDEAK